MTNYLAIVVAAVASMAVGFLWYSPSFLGKPWMKAMGMTEKELKKAQAAMGPKYGLAFVAALVTAYVLNCVIGATDMATLEGGVKTGALMWLGFTTTVQLTDWIFSSKKVELYYINTAYQLTCLVVMGAILGMWR